MSSAGLPFSTPSISEPEIEAAAQVLRSGWTSTGRAQPIGPVHFDGLPA